MGAPAIKQISVEEYLHREATAETKHEYVDGELVAMAGATYNHNLLVSNIVQEIGSCLKGKNCRVLPSGLRVTTPAGNNYFYPDATVVCGEAQLQSGVFDTLLNPTIIIEIMSESTENIDRGYKFFYYQRIPVLQEYFLIDSRQKSIEVIRRQADDSWKFDRLPSENDQVHLHSIDCTILIHSIYAGVWLGA